MRNKFLPILILAPLLLLAACNRTNFFKEKEDRAKTTSYQKVLPFDEDNIVLRAQVFSDEHTSRVDPVNTSNIYVENVKEFNRLTGQDSYDISLSCGDHTMTGNLDEDLKFINSFNEANPKGDIKSFFSCFGNHDIAWGGCASRSEHSSFFGQYHLYDNDEEDSHPELGNRHKIVNGFHFLTVDIDKYGNDNNTLSATTRTWLKNILDDRLLNEPLRPVYIVCHTPPMETVYGSMKSEYMGGRWGASQELKDMMENYPNVIFFSGHTHYAAQIEKSIWQGGFTAINVPTISGGLGWDQNYVGLEKASEETFDKYIHGLDAHNMYDTGAGLYMEIDKDFNTRITRYFLGNHDAGQIKNPWVIEAPKADKSHLNRYNHEKLKLQNENPYVADDFTFTLYESSFGDVSIQFDTFLDDDMIYAYDIQLFKKEKSLIGDKDTPDERYLFLDDWRFKKWQKNVKNEFTYNFKTNIFGYNYSIRVIAMDCWNAYTIKYPTDIVKH